MLGLDDTLARKRDLKMFGTGMHYDPILSSRGKAITNWGGDVPIIVETGDGLAGENLGLLVLVFNGSRPIFIA